MSAVTSAERVQELRHQLELMLTLDTGSVSTLDELLAKVAALPRTQDRTRLMDDVLDVRSAVTGRETG